MRNNGFFSKNCVLASLPSFASITLKKNCDDFLLNFNWEGTSKLQNERLASHHLREYTSIAFFLRQSTINFQIADKSPQLVSVLEKPSSLHSLRFIE